MTADDLVAAFATVPPEWAAVLPGWTPERCTVVQEAVRAVSDDRPIAPEDPFRALRLVVPTAVKVVIVGQDPYPKAGQADGLAFSVARGTAPSLRRVFEVLAAGRPGFVPPSVWRLDAWAEQGVLLLNPALTVEIGRAGSHLRCGWQALTSEIVQVLCQRPVPPTFLIWGAQAQSFFLQATRRLGHAAPVLLARHPSYDLRREFMADGSHFDATRDLVDWWAIETCCSRVV